MHTRTVLAAATPVLAMMVVLAGCRDKLVTDPGSPRDEGLGASLSVATAAYGVFRAPDAQETALFGSSVAGVGEKVLVGAPQHNPNGMSNAGQAYLFDQEGASVQTFQAPEPEAHADFGRSVAGVRGKVLVGAPGQNIDGRSKGEAYLFDQNGALLHTFQAPDPQEFGDFGWSVAAVSERILVGAAGHNIGGLRRAGEAFLFDQNGALLQTFQAPDAAEGTNFGLSVASVGEKVLIGAPNHTFDGLPQAGQAYLFDQGGALLHIFRAPAPQAGVGFGRSVASVGENVLIGAPSGSSGGRAYLFDQHGALLRTFQAPEPQQFGRFGAAVEGVGDMVLVGAPAHDIDGLQHAGHAYLFDQNGTLLQRLQAPDAQSFASFGGSAGSVGEKALVAAHLQDVDGVVNAGQVYLFDPEAGPIDDIGDPELIVEYETSLFDDLPAGESQTLWFTVRNTGGVTANGEVAIAAPRGVFSLVGDSEFQIDPEQSWDIGVRFAPTSSTKGEFFSRLRIQPDADIVVDAPLLMAESSPCANGDHRRCDLIDRLRHEDYFRMSRAVVMNTSLFDYLGAGSNEDAFGALVAYVSYGRHLSDFIHEDPFTQSDAEATTEELRKAMDKAGGLVPSLLEKSGLVLRARGEEVAGTALSRIGHFVKMVHLGYKTLDVALRLVFFDWAKDALERYFNNRFVSSPEAVWNESILDHERISLSKQTSVPIACLPDWLEQAYGAYRFAGTVWNRDDPEALRFALGQVLAEMARDEEPAHDLGLKDDECTKIPAKEYAALEVFYKATNETADDWVKSDGWPALVEGQRWPDPEDMEPSSLMEYVDPGSWHGIRVDEIVVAGIKPFPTATNNHVTRLELSKNKLVGKLPEAIADLERLEQLDVSDNVLLRGPLPSKLMELEHLAGLDFSGTNLCVPNEEYQTWLDTLKKVRSSGIRCDE